MSLKKDDRAFLEESLRGHIVQWKSAWGDAVEGVCLRGQEEDVEILERMTKHYMALLRAKQYLADICA